MQFLMKRVFGISRERLGVVWFWAGGSTSKTTQLISIYKRCLENVKKGFGYYLDFISGIVLDKPIADVDDSLGLFGDLRIMSDDDQGGAAFLIQGEQEAHDLFS